MPDFFQTLWNEPRAPDAPPPLWRDWVLVTLLIALAVAEGVVSDTLAWRWPSVALTIMLAFMLPWRRTHPLAVAALGFGSTAVLQALAIAGNTEWTGLDTNVFMVMLPYSLLRWGSGREAMVGLAAIAVSFTISMAVDEHPWAEVIGASLFVLFPAALGASVRYQNAAQRRSTAQVRLRERERLARELHDTVAHHVSAIAVQAQAGRAVATARPEASAEALERIEEAASRTLTDMRRIVGALRAEADSRTELRPRATLADIERLAMDNASPLRINVTLEGELDDLDSTLQSTLYRIAQEAVTNAMRHARGANNVAIRIAGRKHETRMSVIDDGKAVADANNPGFGLRGMAERVSLLGGTLQAGPAESGGWRVDAVLPCHAGRS